MRFLLCSLALLAGTQASAEQLTLDRIHSDPSLAGPGVRSLKVSPDGARVTFLRGRDDNQFQLDLWEYNLKDKNTHRLIDSKILVAEENLSEAEKARRDQQTKQAKASAKEAKAARRQAQADARAEARAEALRVHGELDVAEHGDLQVRHAEAARQTKKWGRR